MHDKKGSWDKAVVRTGHEVKDIHTSFHHLLDGSKTAIDAAKLVQGWTHPDDDKCLPATCDSFMTPENKDLVIALVRKLFNQRWSILDSHLNRFVMNMFAMLPYPGLRVYFPQSPLLVMCQYQVILLISICIYVY
jgi:hypothetical protein